VNDAIALCLLRLTFHLLFVDNTGKDVIAARRFREKTVVRQVTRTHGYCIACINVMRPTLPPVSASQVAFCSLSCRSFTVSICMNRLQAMYEERYVSVAGASFKAVSVLISHHHRESYARHPLESSLIISFHFVSSDQSSSTVTGVLALCSNLYDAINSPCMTILLGYSRS